MQPTGRYNKAGVRILRNSDAYSSSNTRPGYTEGRTIRQNVALTGRLIEQAVRSGDNTLTRRTKRVPPWFG
ncbi:MAG TPA: hypothetical protein VK578_18970 [Edaphobacter sp.]|nr:hypothetical protein [Edaphobacter sp.]